MGLFEKVFGTHSEKELKKIAPIVDKIEALDSDMQALSDEELRAKTAEFKERLANGETLDDLLVEAFAVVREAAYRVLGIKHYRVQLIGGVVLHQGRIAEMKTGEGKTLVSTLPVYLNALEGKGVQVVTVNDYLAKRDAEWMGKVHEFLGLTVGIILNSSTNDERRDAYACDITYVTNNELGFDYLRDNMVIYKEKLVLRGLHYCVIDEVDSVLIDEARTPLIISGQSGKSTELYKMCDYLARRMKRGEGDGEISKMDMLMNTAIEEDGDFLVNEKDKYVMLTANGVKEVATAEELTAALENNANDTVKLTADITIGTTLTVSRTVTLDLNGNVLKMTGGFSVIKVESGGDLTIADSTPNKVHKFNPNYTDMWGCGLWKLDKDTGTEIVSGGVITGGGGDLTHSDGGGVAGKSQGLALGQTGGEAEYLGAGRQNLFLIARALTAEQAF